MINAPQPDLFSDPQTTKKFDRLPHTIRLRLTDAEAAILLQDRGGKHASGGMQNRYRKWKAAYDPASGEIVLDQDDVIFIRRTIPNWRNGGYQSNTRKIFERALREWDQSHGSAW